MGDNAVPAVEADIQVKLRGLMDKHVVNPTSEIVDGGKCGFMSEKFQPFVSAFCFQGILGLNKMGQAFTAVGFLDLFWTLLMYGVWRRTLDSHNAEVDELVDARGFA